MSRHRFVKQINIHDELEDDAIYDDEDDYDLTEEQEIAMNSGLAEIRRILGPESESGLTDADIKSSLYNSWFDVGQTVEWLFAQQEKARAARERQAAKEREKAQRLATQQQKKHNTPTKTKTTTPPGASTPKKKVGKANNTMEARDVDIAGLNLNDKAEEGVVEEPPKVTMAREKVLEEARKELEAKEKQGKKAVSLVVIGHVDAGKSTLMGRLLYEVGRIDERKRIANERGSAKAGKSSFSWAWELDGTTEERERGITMDIAQQSLVTPHRQITVLDAPGHKDFIPNMISGATQADCALLVVDATTGEFEAGFEKGGQTREHLLLVRSLGVSQVIVAINKLDQVQWAQERYDDIISQLQPFLVQSGYQPSKTKFVPVGAIQGVNLATCEGADAEILKTWYTGPMLVDLLDQLEPPVRDLDGPLRLPLSNVFKTTGSGCGVAGRVCSGVIQVGERVRVLPGDETAVVKSIEHEEENVSWTMAGSNVSLYLTSIDAVNLSIGSVLCPPSDLVPLATVFTAKVIIFDIAVPITAGASVELFHHSRDVPATIVKLVASLDRAAGTVIKQNPRVLTKGMSAEVQIALRVATMSGASSARPIPMEPFAKNKEMGRILVRRGGETIGAGIVLSILE